MNLDEARELKARLLDQDFHPNERVQLTRGHELVINQFGTVVSIDPNPSPLGGAIRVRLDSGRTLNCNADYLKKVGYSNPLDAATLDQQTQYHNRVSAPVRDHAANLVRAWINNGRNDETIENVVKAAVLFAYLEGEDNGAAEEFNTQTVTKQAITEAVARGWCHPDNERLVMDPLLAYAIVDEIVSMLDNPEAVRNVEGIPPGMQGRIDHWLDVNQVTASTVRHGVFPYGFVNNYVERALTAEADLEDAVAVAEDNESDVQFFEGLHRESMLAYVEERRRRRALETERDAVKIKLGEGLDKADPKSEIPAAMQHLYDSGLLWLINASILHPRGFALAADMDEDKVVGLEVVGDGQEPWCFGQEPDGSWQSDAAYQRFVRTESEREAKWTPLVNPQPIVVPDITINRGNDREIDPCLSCGTPVYIDDERMSHNAVDDRLHTCSEFRPAWSDASAQAPDAPGRNEPFDVRLEAARQALQAGDEAVIAYLLGETPLSSGPDCTNCTDCECKS